MKALSRARRFSAGNFLITTRTPYKSVLSESHGILKDATKRSYQILEANHVVRRCRHRYQLANRHP